jgi:sec-independent protein translocase protein TatB
VFDFSFGEVLVVGAVALVVIGPERLPKVARTVGALLARAQRYVNSVKTDIQREIEFDSLRQLEAEMNEAGRKLGNELMGGVGEIQQSLQASATEVRQALSEPPSKTASTVTPVDPSPVATGVEQQFDLFATTSPVPERPARDRR